ncbi:MAG: hypothetical protein GX113_05820 [Actinobacteria bacterium]|jgi:hypothetical protein|nr:hypothetical protein [Actinomycetota bacterium]
MALTIRRRLVDHVRQWRRTAYTICAGLVVLAGAAVFLSVSSPASSVEVASGPTFFDSTRAYRAAQVMSDLYSNRMLGSEGSASVINWIAEKLPERVVAAVDKFEAPMGVGTETLRNAVVVLEGTSRESVLVAAPRDTPLGAEVEPLAYATGTAMLIELIHVFAERPHQKTLIFLSTEDSDTGGLGINRFLDTNERGRDVSTILSIHGLGRERTTSLGAGVTGPKNTTPGWYVQLVGRLLAEVNLRLRVPGLLSQAADRALSLSKGDQVAGLSRGIASLRLYDNGPGNPTADGLATQGAAIERLLLSLDSGTEAPPDPGTALLLESGRYLTNRATTFLAALMLLPTLAALLIWLFSSRVTGRPAALHLRNLLSFALPVGWMLLVAYILARAGLIPLYHLQVPVVEGPSTQPRLAPTLIIILTGAVVFVASRRFLGYLHPQEGKAATEMTKLCAGFTGLIVGLVLMLSRSPFLVLPGVTAAWAWPLATCFAEPVYSGALWRHRLTTNAPVLLAGLIVPVALYIYLATSYGVGWLRAWWFLIVQTVSGSYGVRGPLAVMFIAASLAVLAGVKRMRVIPIETLEQTDELSLLEPPIPRSRRKPRPPARPPLSPWR